MRILVVSNLYPPHHIGGYELGCRDVVDALRGRGHEVAVLTSTYGVGRPRVEGHVYRWLRSDWDARPAGGPGMAAAILRRELSSRRAFRRLSARLRPDVVYVWNAVGISVSIAVEAEKQGLPVHYYLSEGWLGRAEREDAWFSLVAGRASHPLKQLALRGIRLFARASGLPRDLREAPFRHLQFTSRYVLEEARAAIPQAGAGRVIHWGVDGEAFPFRVSRRAPSGRLLYVGRLSREKGVETALHALARVRTAHGFPGATLDVVGGSVDASYLGDLRALAESLGIAEGVRFHGGLPRPEVAAAYHAHDVLVFPSVWGEPFSITLLEAMAAGIPVVATPTGGTAEILRDGDNALLFPPGDAVACAERLARLLADPALGERLRRCARDTVESRFTFGAMVDEIARTLAPGHEQASRPAFPAGNP